MRCYFKLPALAPLKTVMALRYTESSKEEWRTNVWVTSKMSYHRHFLGSEQNASYKLSDIVSVIQIRDVSNEGRSYFRIPIEIATFVLE